MKKSLSILMAPAMAAGILMVRQPLAITQKAAAMVSIAIPGLQAATPPQSGQRAQSATPQAAQSAPLDTEHCKCSIEVTVKRNGTGEPIGEVEVTLNRAAIASAAAIMKATITAAEAAKGRNVNSAIVDGLLTGLTRAPDAATSTTDSSGHAVFHDLAEGTYSVEAKRKGYFGVSSDNYPPQVTANVAVGPENQSGARGTARQQVQHITLDMVQGVTISGSLLDANRQPASGVQIGAFQLSYQDGHRVLAQSGNAVQADDRGEFRLFWFSPGEYYIRAGASGVTAALRATTGGGGTNYPATYYYPGTTDPKLAVPVVVREGSDLTGIDIALQTPTGVTVSGTIINTIPGGQIDLQDHLIRSIASVYLVPRNPYFSELSLLLSDLGSAVRTATNSNPQNDSESTFEIRGVPPGSYDFYSVFNDGAAARSGGLETGHYSARTPIEVGAENITGIQSVIRPGADLKGYVTISGNPPAPAATRPAQTLALASIRVHIQPKDTLPSQVVRDSKTTNAVDANGQFTMTNMIDARYFISGVSPLPADAYVSEIRQDSRSVFDENIITIAQDPQSMLDVVISRGGGTIQGVVQDAKHNPVAAARITLIPEMPRRQNSLLYKTAASNATGSFNLNGIAPGHYKLFAWERNPNGGEQNAEFMRDYDALGVSVNVEPGLPLANVQVPIIPAKR